MPTRYFKRLLVGCLWLLLGSCIEPYQPEVLQTPSNYLVVDGFINYTGITHIRLSRLANLAGSNIPPGEAHARVSIEEEGGRTFMLKEEQSGSYTSNPLQLDRTRRYRLRIHTANGQEYASALVETKVTPPIDSISWKTDADGLQVYVGTHDPAQNSRYYRWTYEETWEFYSAFESAYEYRNNRVELRQEGIYHCWRQNISSAILIGSSAKLSQDVISEFPLIKLPSNSLKIKYKYSILVKQYALSKDAYEYAELLKKNTENIGTLFDPLPSQLTGNIQCLTTPTEPVIGFVSVSSQQEKRIFISRSQVPNNWRPGEEYAGCTMDTVLLKDIVPTLSAKTILPLGEAYSEQGSLIGYTTGSYDCTDCRIRGTNVRPTFWE